MSYSEKYELAIKPYIKITDCIKILGTNSNVFKPRWIAMVKDLEKQTNMKFGPWGIPNKLVMDYLGLDIELLRMNAEYEKKSWCTIVYTNKKEVSCDNSPEQRYYRINLAWPKAL